MFDVNETKRFQILVNYLIIQVRFKSYVSIK